MTVSASERPIRVNPRPMEGEPIIDARCIEPDCGWAVSWEMATSVERRALQEWYERKITAHVRDTDRTVSINVLGEGLPHRVDVRRAKTERWIAS